jgi:CRP-like cAMP-binding protein
MELQDALRSLPGFVAIGDEDIDALSKSFAIEDRPDGYVFTKEGDRAAGCFLVLAGTVSVVRNRGPYLDELTRLGEGELFGVASLVVDAPRAATCRAVGPVRVAVLDAETLKWLLAAHGPVALAVQRAIADQLAKDFRTVASAVRKALEERARG